MTDVDASHGGAPATPDPLALLDALPDIVLAIDAGADVVYVNAAADDRGWDRAGWIGRSVLDLVHPDDLPIALSAMETVQRKSLGSLIEIRIAHPVEGWQLFEVIGRNEFEGDLGLLVLSCRDIGERRRWEVASGDTARFQAVVQHSSAATMLVDPDGRIHSVSAAITRLAGLDAEDLVGMPFASLAAPGHELDLAAALRRRERPGSSVAAVEVPVRRPRGDECLLRFDVVDLCDDPVVRGYVVTAHDVSELHSTRDALRRLATHDALTGLPNRVALNRALGEALDRREGFGEVGVLFVGLDRFKPVNDLFGQDAGDELLVAVADRLAGVVRVGDTVARIGGDEFVVLAPNLASRASIEALGRRVEQAIAAPFVLGSGVVRISASVGVAYGDGTSSVASLLAEADQSMFRVKTARRSGVGSGPQRPRRWTERRELAEVLRGAIDRDEFKAYLQPVVDVADGRLRGFEALVRWHHPDGRVLGPGEFLDVAVEAGVGTALDRVISDQACSLLAGLLPMVPDAWVSVNMTAHDLVDPAMVATVAGTLARHGIPPQQLVVEVTEQATLEQPGVGDQASPQSTLRDLARLGVRVALDDFGTGYSSLTHLRGLTVHTIKIDRSFVSGITRDTTDHTLVAAIIGLAHALGLQAVAEGIESEEQMAIVRELGCDGAQGYLVSPAIAPDAIGEWVRAYVGRTARAAV